MSGRPSESQLEGLRSPGLRKVSFTSAGQGSGVVGGGRDCILGCAVRAEDDCQPGVGGRSHSGCGLEFQEKKPGSLKMESLRPGSGRVRVSGADFFLGRSFGTVRNSGASVERGVDGALLGPPRAQDGSGVSEMEMAGGNVPILRLVASCVARSYSLTSSMVMSVGMETH